MALSDRLVNELQVKLVGATVNMLRLEIWNMLDDFCREGLAWRETISVTPVVDQYEYVITPAGAEIVRVFSVDHETLDLTGANYDFGTLTLYVAPTSGDVAYPLNVVSALAPALDQGDDIENMVPADMWSKFHRTFVKGVLGMAMAQPAKPYSNPQLAAHFWRGYLIDRAVARREAETGGYQGAQLWSFPRFGR